MVLTTKGHAKILLEDGKYLSCEVSKDWIRDPKNGYGRGRWYMEANTKIENRRFQQKVKKSGNWEIHDYQQDILLVKGKKLGDQR